MKQTYSFLGTVIRGLQNGRKMNYPTANLQTDDSFNLADGIYVAETSFDDSHYFGMLYVGTRPTLHLKEKSIELHLLDFQDNIYDKVLHVTVLHKIRDDITFDNLTQLQKQIEEDEKNIRYWLQTILLN